MSLKGPLVNHVTQTKFELKTLTKPCFFFILYYNSDTITQSKTKTALLISLSTKKVVSIGVFLSIFFHFHTMEYEKVPMETES